ncbi:DNA-binding protein SMUBP-2 [Nephila pilipes]|uniref:DNA-binding protein SMUBP-2 n=1 Tax=Nephila pilipes TaxID=299642 RepID=A0A8X6MS98_NEPPI|nr:DNA-binding protein SMUBP-2 [Nephila pilipes]
MSVVEDITSSLRDKRINILQKLEVVDASIAKDILHDCDIVFCTLTSASSQGPLKYVNKNHFDVCIIDECSQAIEAACWIPLHMVKKCILAGDHNQLPPIILSKKAAKAGLKVTMMERLLKLHGDCIKIMLTTQYRMNQVIMQFPSKYLYENRLVAHDSVRSWLLKDLKGVKCNRNTTAPLLLIDTTGYDMHELRLEGNASRCNEGEADLVYLHVNGLVESGMSPADIGVITPYKLQAGLIKSRLGMKYPSLEINCVDGFQGREKEAIVLSLVRSNTRGEVGFLAENQRINVAITRAKRHLAIVCDRSTISCNRFLNTFIDYCIKNGEVRAAFQCEGDIDVGQNIKQNILFTETESMLQKINFHTKEANRYADAKHFPFGVVKNFEIHSTPTFSTLRHAIYEVQFVRFGDFLEQALYQ